MIHSGLCTACALGVSLSLQPAHATEGTTPEVELVAAQDQPDTGRMRYAGYVYDPTQPRRVRNNPREGFVGVQQGITLSPAEFAWAVGDVPRAQQLERSVRRVWVGTAASMACIGVGTLAMLGEAYEASIASYLAMSAFTLGVTVPAGMKLRKQRYTIDEAQAAIGAQGPLTPSTAVGSR